jgi:hypothetical protein
MDDDDSSVSGPLILMVEPLLLVGDALAVPGSWFLVTGYCGSKFSHQTEK